MYLSMSTWQSIFSDIVCYEPVKLWYEGSIEEHDMQNRSCHHLKTHLMNNHWRKELKLKKIMMMMINGMVMHTFTIHGRDMAR